ncbi:CHASE2 domain-containing protein [Ramlibacter albus]|uniref:Adenylate/guanylate cyclase domain-containing protein n=1 Tax=Ramlibacter albus TaxID=2079448 RepID=A0A923M8B3_9BURK|nr:adenylate/guanylate cyclase domain-containing protein [Ramlibacter albus]MBC5764743.1 adenylate/guanylate cyclase domain-containing protein [Ramlibacter albus]
MTRRRGWATHWVAGAGLAVAALLWAVQALLFPALLSEAEERSGDLVWRLTAERRDERRIIVVDVDERSLREVGAWPWSRATLAKLSNQVAAQGASQQVFDVVFTDPKADDEELAKAVSRNSAVLAQVFALQQGGSQAVGQLGGALDWKACPAPFQDASGYLANAPKIRSDFVGHITPRLDGDGLVRHVPAVICFQGRSYPSLAVAAFMRGTGEQGLALQRGESPFDAPWLLTGKNLPSGAVPLDGRGDLRVAWRIHPESIVSISAADVLAGRVPAGLMSNAWVLVGSTAFGLNDSIATPFAAAGAGLQVHVQLMAGLIDGRTPYEPQAAVLYQLAMALLGFALLVLLGRDVKRFPVYLVPVAALLWAAALWALHSLVLYRGSVWLGWIQPAFFLVVAGVAMGILQHARSRFDRNRLFTHLSSYLPAPVAAALASQSPSSAITASTNLVSVMFADIRNFSAYCEARPPEECAAVLHAFFSTAARIVEGEGGVIESFQGDAVVAVWNGDPGEPGTAGADHAKRALQAAVKLHEAMRGSLPDPAPGGLEPLALGIGVETGPAMAGSFGQASRRTHMVLGRTVTIASRLVDMTAELAHPILVGEGLAAQVGAAGLESLGTFLLEGLRVPHHIYAYPLVSALGKS